MKIKNERTYLWISVGFKTRWDFLFYEQFSVYRRRVTESCTPKNNETLGIKKKRRMKQKGGSPRWVRRSKVLKERSIYNLEEQLYHGSMKFEFYLNIKRYSGRREGTWERGTIINSCSVHGSVRVFVLHEGESVGGTDHTGVSGKPNGGVTFWREESE